MADLLTYGLVLVALIALAALIYLIMAVNTTADDRERKPPPMADPPMGGTNDGTNDTEPEEITIPRRRKAGLAPYRTH